MKALMRLLVLAVLVAGVTALVVELGRRCGPLTIAHWRAQLDAVPEQSAEPLLAHFGGTGDMAIPILVESLGSPRARVARAGRQSLLTEIDHWKTLSAAGNSTRFALLARELSDRRLELGPAGRHDAAELAVLILQGPLDPGTVDTVEVIACCEEVLRAAQADPPELVAEAQAKRAERDVASASNAAAGGQDVAKSWGVPSDTAGAGLLPLPAAPAASDTPPQPLAKIAAVAKTADSAAAKPFWGLPQLWRNDAGAASAESDKQPASDQAVRQASAVEKLPADKPSDELKSADSFDLLERSCSPVAELAAAARAELSRRGFNEVHFDLARRMFSADPAVRKELARALPELRSIDAAPWLMQLSKDTDPEVRLTAITLMATSGDPLLLAEVERIAGADSDPRIREQVERIAQQRNDASQRGAATAARGQSRY